MLWLSFVSSYIYIYIYLSHISCFLFSSPFVDDHFYPLLGYFEYMSFKRFFFFWSIIFSVCFSQSLFSLIGVVEVAFIFIAFSLSCACVTTTRTTIVIYRICSALCIVRRGGPQTCGDFVDDVCSTLVHMAYGQGVSAALPHSFIPVWIFHSAT